MDYQVQLNNGRVIELKNAEFDVVAFTETLNNQKINFVNVGGAIINKHIIVSIIPVSNVVEEVAKQLAPEAEKQEAKEQEAKAAEPEVEKQV